MTSKPDTLELPKMPQWEWNSLLHNFRHVNRPMDSSATSLHPSQPLANPPTCIAALYAKSKASIASKCSLQLHKTTTTAVPYSDYTICLDTYHSSYSPSQHNNSDMPRETYGNNRYLTTNTYTETTYGMQCHFSSFLPTP